MKIVSCVVPTLLSFIASRPPRSTAHRKRRVAHLRRRPRQHPLLAARPDQRGQLQQARSRVALQDRQPRPAARVQLEATPLMVNGVLYTTAGTRRAVVALDAATGELLWMHGETKASAATAAPRQLSGRGLAYWTDGRRRAHPLRHARLPAGRARREDRASGRRLRQERRRRSEAERRSGHRSDRPARSACTRRRSSPRTSSSSARRIARAATPKSMRNVKGYVRGFDVRTGKRLWIFHTIPQPGEFGNDTWENGFVRVHRQHRRLGADHGRRGARLVYLPVELADRRLLRRPSPRQQSVRREPGRASICKTGKRKWHFQLVHHGIWDYGYPVRADPGRYHRRRQGDQGGRAADQAGVPLRVRSRDRASRSGRSRSGRCRRATCRASGTRRRSRSRPSRRRTIGRA